MVWLLKICLEGVLFDVILLFNRDDKVYMFKCNVKLVVNVFFNIYFYWNKFLFIKKIIEIINMIKYL